MASAETAFVAQTTASGDSLSVCEVEAAPNFVSPPTPSSEASKSTCSAPPLEVEMDEDSPVASPIGGSTPTLSSLLTSGKSDIVPASDLRLSSAAARKIMFDQVKAICIAKRNQFINYKFIHVILKDIFILVSLHHINIKKLAFNAIQYLIG